MKRANKEGFSDKEKIKNKNKKEVIPRGKIF